VSPARFLGILCLSASLYAQLSSPTPSVSVWGELRSKSGGNLSDFMVELYDMRINAVVERALVSNGRFQLDRVPVGSYSVRLVTSPGEPPIVEEFVQIDTSNAPLILDLPERFAGKPISGIVSLHELEHPIPKKALQEAYEAQQLVLAKDLPKAIDKLQHALRIAPDYRDAHLNLGVLYARTQRVAAARAEFQKALDIGPPASQIYVDLALASQALGETKVAEKFAQQALELDPANKAAHGLLQASSFH
jgi:tetratricopeptide (TPR) repeat protein